MKLFIYNRLTAICCVKVQTHIYIAFKYVRWICAVKNYFHDAFIWHPILQEKLETGLLVMATRRITRAGANDYDVCGVTFRNLKRLQIQQILHTEHLLSQIWNSAYSIILRLYCYRASTQLMLATRRITRAGANDYDVCGVTFRNLKRL